MRFCNFCKNHFNEIDKDHWVSNGKLRSRCRFQLISYNKKSVEEKHKYNQVYYSNNKDSILNKIKISYQENKLEISANRLKRRNENPLLRVKDSYSSSAKRAFAQNGYDKNTKSAALLGCSFEELKVHLELKFDQSMSWDNYGIMWEIDHVCPIHQAKTYDEVIMLCNYINLRPLSVTLNRRKHKRKTYEAEMMCKSLLNRDWKEGELFL